MKPFILNFAEEPKRIEFDISGIEYSEKYNLTVIKESGKPAISEHELDTTTFKKSKEFPTDTDYENNKNKYSKLGKLPRFRSILETRTITEAGREVTDED